MKKETEKSVLYLFLILFFGWILSQFILINQNSLIISGNQITSLALQIDPLKTAGDFLGGNINIGRGIFPFWAILATFAIVFSTVFILVRSVHLFKGDEHRGAAIAFALGISLLTLFATDIVSIIVYLATTVTVFVVIIALLLVFWAGYLGLHKSVSSGIGEISQVAAERYQSKEAAGQAKSAYFQTANAYESAKQERNVLKGLKNKVYKKDTKNIQNLLSIFDNLANRQLYVNRTVNKILDRISRYGIPTDKKKQVNDLVKDIKNLESGFESKVKEIRNAVERVKVGIKANDFTTAEARINDALNFEGELESITKQIAQKELEINRILLSP